KTVAATPKAINPANKCGIPCLPLAHNTIRGSYFPGLTPQLNFMRDLYPVVAGTVWKPITETTTTGTLPIWFYLDLQTRGSILKCRLYWVVSYSKIYVVLFTLAAFS